MPNLSISAKLYTIFTLLALAAIVLAVSAVTGSRRHAASTREFERALTGIEKVERVNGLIYAVVMESRGIYMSPDIATAKKFAAGLLHFNARIGEVVRNWHFALHLEEAERFDAFAKRIAQFQEFRRELVRRGTEISPAAGRDWGDNDANRTIRSALNSDLEELARIYDARAKRVYASLQQDVSANTWIVSALAIVAMMLAAVGGVIIWRAVARPLTQITHVTELIAQGESGVV